MHNTRIYRAIDANANRAVEGLRVVEDALRFLCDNAAITAQLRQLRHALRGAAASLPGGEQALLNARDSGRDIARNAPPREQGGITGLVRSNLSRAQEATRSLEEFSKLLDPAAATAFGEIRFKLYDLEKDISTAIDAATSASAVSTATASITTATMPAAPFLYAIADYATLSSGETPFAYLHAIIDAGTKIIQLRDKPAPGGEPIPDKELLHRAKQIAGQIAPTGALFFVNDRTDIALASGAHGVHLGADDLPIKEAREIVSATAVSTGANNCETDNKTAAVNPGETNGAHAARKLLIGVSTHTVEEAIAADALNPDYVAFGPVFASPTKSGRAPLGAAALAQACAAISLPVVAIGGITEDNIAQIATAGASGAAVISALSGATSAPGSTNPNSNPAAPEIAADAARKLVAILESNYRNPRR